MTRDADMFWLLFSPSGRIGRQSYALSILLWVALHGALLFMMLSLESSRGGLALAAMALVIVSIGFFVSLIMLSIKRLHDMGRPGFFVLLLFLPIVSFAALAVFLFWPSAPPNQFGHFTNRPE